MSKETEKGSAQLEIGSPEWIAARAREAAKEKLMNEREEAERQRKEEERRRAEAEALREELLKEVSKVRGDMPPEAPPKKRIFM